MYRTLGFAILGLLLLTGVSGAAVVEFIPPSDPVGSVFSTSSNDGYAGGRGVVFEMSSPMVVSAIGIYHDLTGVTLSWEFAETTLLSGTVTTGQTVLRSGSTLVTTSGLEWIDVSFAPLALSAGSYYHFEFSHGASGNQNFFYNQSGAEPYDQGTYLNIDGTSGGNTSNFVIPALRLDVTAVPEPSTFALLGLGLAALGGAVLRRRRRRRT